MATHQSLFKTNIPDPDDPYWMIRRIFIDIFQYKFVKLLLKLLLLCNTVLIILQTVVLLEVFNAVFFIKYYMMYIASIYIWITLYSISQMEKSVSCGIRDLREWEVGTTDPVIEKLNRKKIFYENVFVIVHVLLATVTGIAYIIPDEKDKDFFLVWVVFERFFPVFANIIFLLCRLSFFVLPIIMLAPFHMIIYYCGYTRRKFTAFTKSLEDLNDGFDDVDPLKSVYDEEYQREITRRLKFCIRSHVRLYSINSQLLRDLSHYIFLYSIIGVLFAIGIVVYGVTFQSSSLEKYVRVLGLAFCFVFMFVHMIWVGQITEDTTSDLFEALKQTVWYYWNDKNKKIFLMFLLNGEKSFKMQYSENVSVNYELGVSILKSIYSTIMVLANLKNNYSLEGN
ncbi:hypothetical protein Zmor_008271 [Zophobas morio]|uniref:Odorant receptor n=1 Tax=Zophobas morio TaxID=2755281 RepID=A0AA38IV66_9CUCU|nr:hypothetical protein Zmor_008271 [Zophobas morio]